MVDWLCTFSLVRRSWSTDWPTGDCMMRPCAACPSSPPTSPRSCTRIRWRDTSRRPSRALLKGRGRGSAALVQTGRTPRRGRRAATASRWSGPSRPGAALRGKRNPEFFSSLLNFHRALQLWMKCFGGNNFFTAPVAGRARRHSAQHAWLPSTCTSCFPG